MKPTLTLAALAAVLVFASQASALWEIAPVTRDVAKALGIDVRFLPAGPDQVRVELEFKAEGPLKNYSRVDLRVGQGDNPPVTAPLREERAKEGRVVVGFAADRAQLDRLSLWIFVPESLGGTIYAVQVKDFVEPKKDR